jgi:hypothetical protein
MDKKSFLKHGTSRYFTSRNLSINDPDTQETLFWKDKSLSEIDHIIFLDIDGVLNTDKTYWRFKTHDQSIPFIGIDRDLVKILNPIAEMNSIYFVLSSTWREMYYDTLNYLSYQGFKGKFIGKTILPDCHRGDEILDWIRRNNYNGNWLAIDDDEKCKGLGDDHWVQTINGINESHINKIKSIFSIG